MGVESATYIGDLTPTAPGSSDLVSQGDDHIRLLKQVLQNSFPGLEKAIYFPTTAAKSADFSVVAADMNKSFLVITTSGLINMTLPSTLGVGDAGWECFLIKASFDANPVLVKPASGTLTSGSIAGLAAARRCIPGVKISIYWTGSSFIVGRSSSVAGPVGSVIEYHGATLPYGFEFPNGQTLGSASANYPEYSAVMGSGVTLDKRGRVGLPLDNLGGSAAGRLGTIITATAIGNVGGTETAALTASLIPTITSTGAGVGISGSTTSKVVNGPNQGSAAAGGSQVTAADPGSGGALSTVGVSGSTASLSVSSSNTGGTSPVHSNLQPSIMVSQLLIVE